MHLEVHVVVQGVFHVHHNPLCTPCMAYSHTGTQSYRHTGIQAYSQTSSIQQSYILTDSTSHLNRGL
jgi:hypothetical protein